MYLAPDNNNKPDSLVTEVQRMLNAIGSQYHFSWPRLEPDGRYGVKSAEAVGEFQATHGISSQKTPLGPILGDTTIEYIRREYASIPSISNASPSLVPYRKFEMSRLKTGVDILSFLTMEGGPVYKELERIFPEIYRNLGKRSNQPKFVFSKADVNRAGTWGGTKYERVNLPGVIGSYLNVVSLLWSWGALYDEIRSFKENLRTSSHPVASVVQSGANLFSLCVASFDTVLAMPFAKEFAKKMATRYAVANTAAAVGSITAATLVSAVGQGIGAFLLGWEIGNLIKKIPVGGGYNVGDVIDRGIDQAWEHPFQTLGFNNPLAMLIALMKGYIDWNVNRVKVVKPLSPEEQKKLDEYLRQNPEFELYAKPPKYSDLIREK